MDTKKFTSAESLKKRTTLLFERWRSVDRDYEAYKDLLVLYRHLIEFEIARFKNRVNNSHFEKEDLVQQGYIGLIKAVEKFDLSRDLAFSTYAQWWVRDEIQRYIEKNQSTVSLANHHARIVPKIAAALSRSSPDHTIYTIPERLLPALSEAVGESVNTVRHIITALPKQQSISHLKRDDVAPEDYDDGVAQDDEYATRLARQHDMGDEDDEVFQHYQAMNYTKYLTLWMDKIEPKYREVLMLSFGLTHTDGEGEYAEILKTLKLSPVGLKKLRLEALSALRKVVQESTGANSLDDL